MYKRLYCIFLVSLCMPVSIFSQSRTLEEGVSGTGFYIESHIDESGFKTLGIAASYSIGGMMDFGVNLETESDLIDDNESTNLYLSLIYNMIVIKQNQLQPINVQLEGSYGYVNTSSEYLDYYNRNRTGQGFDLGFSIFHNFFSTNIFGFTLGGLMTYRNYITTTSDYTDPDVIITVSNTRTENILYGGLVGLTVHPKLWPVFNLELKLMYNNTLEKIVYFPSISIINTLY